MRPWLTLKWKTTVLVCGSFHTVAQVMEQLVETLQLRYSLLARAQAWRAAMADAKVEDYRAGVW
ncbi:hypothetical protein CQA70_29490, partial [Klebsiella pneumoniae]